MANLAAIGDASAQSSGSSADYKALVCIFLAGGNDAHNTVVPVDATSWRCYSATRDPAVMAQLTGQTVPDNMRSIALDLASLRTIGDANRKGLNTGRSFALHPQLTNLQRLYQQGQCAIVANIGPLAKPTTKVDLLDGSFPLPQKLYSHNDQISTWQSFAPEGATGGWGGRLMDNLASLNASTPFSSIGIDSNAVWLDGQTVSPYLLGSSGFHEMGGETGQVFGSPALYAALRLAATTSDRADALTTDYLAVAQHALSTEGVLEQALPGAFVAPWGTPGAGTAAADPLLTYTEPSDGSTRLNGFAQQLQVVARMISARQRSGIGVRRQVFMVTLGGFDHHSDLLRQHGSLMARLDHGLGYFQNCLASMPDGDLRSQVTTFTASEFGRTLVNNGDGADHGWGGHHFIVGGGVKGGEVYGRFPQFMAFDGNGGFFSDQLLNGGILLPGLSVDQLVYTLGKWMGVSEATLAGWIPHIGEFESASRDIGFYA
jgi:uncharacterized protein (DUF1501 family)